MPHCQVVWVVALEQCLTVALQREEQRREREEDAKEQVRLQAEQVRMKQQFAEEKDAEKARRVADSGVRSAPQSWTSLPFRHLKDSCVSGSDEFCAWILPIGKWNKCWPLSVRSFRLVL